MSLIKFMVAGERVEGAGQPFRSVNPATGETNYEVSGASKADVASCVEMAATAATSLQWRNLKPHQRASLLHRIADGMMSRAEDLAITQSRENGKVIAESRKQVSNAAAVFRYYAAACETVGGELTPSRGDYLSMTTYEPYGVVAAVTPWNSPLTMEAQKVAPALAAGNAIILKPSEVTPTVAILLAEIAQAAGVPAGIVNVLTGTGRETGLELIRHPKVRMISFTGGTATGKLIAQTAAERLIPCALELGGKSPHIIFADADLEAALDAVQDGIFEGSGQSCVAGSRLFVQRSILDEVIARLQDRVKRIQVGMPFDPDSRMGPIASFQHRETIERFVASARDEGGEILAGGKRPDDRELEKGAFYLPTLITGLSGGARVCREEIFGPVLVILPFDHEDDLVAQANDTDYGLACGLWTPDVTRAMRVARQIDAGTVWINTYKQLSVSTPFGGFKSSGLGREKGLAGLRLYQQSKSIYLGGMSI
ncbi:aldehyde dehydrogenase [Rhizobium sp. X9]|uniref:aldehyde dehydrogenase n=1 Tax=Rhizobium sp. X9 TaxID=2815360 RepID=UPI001C0B2D67|nr:aldehyde dehydrogenase [Rhizobium sp. X9]